MDPLKAVIVGDGAIGKTCLVDAIKNPTAEMSSAYVPTVAENESFDWQYQGKDVKVDFWDTAGQEAFQALRQMAYSSSHVIIVGFDMTNPDSLSNIISPEDKCWRSEVEAKLPGFEHWILVGTKYDLWQEKGGVSEEDIHKVAAILQPKNVIYSSAYTKHNCAKVQEEILRVGIANQAAEPILAWEPPKPEAVAPAAAPAPDAAPAPASAHAAPPVAAPSSSTSSDEDKEGCCVVS
eukprot:TRINITY_DN869_c0_g1_i8.p1 TRINITY_DN869_c0_g1~~TRINITY_DN869_c0_g1_i8.p1  ORF type:complete len:236 (-),score=54.48 TRINITY_DN869_c0_g1_i8:201-908(-)